MFSEEDVKGEEYLDEDFDSQTSAKHELPSTSKMGTTVKRTKNKGVPLSQNSRRNSTRVTNKYRLKSKAMFNPSIKEENFIVIEDHSEDVCKVAREVVGGPRGPIVIIVDVIQCKVD